MTFKWTYITAGLLAVIGVAVALPVDGGGWGAFSMMQGIVLVALGGGLVLLSRTRKPAPMTNVRNGHNGRNGNGRKVPFVSYPNHQVLAVIDDPHAAVEAIRELRHHGLTGKVEVYRGPEGAAAIDSEGTAHGLTGVTERSVEHLIADLDDMSNYDEAVRAGKVVLAFNGRNELARREGARLLMAHGAHHVQYFGGMSVEVLDIDHSRTRV